MSQVYFISDLHFEHDCLIRNLRNMDPREHDQLIIDNWNNIITKKDTVYLLGDITFEKPEIIIKYLSKLKGQIRIIGGNHDTRECCNIITQLKIPILGCMAYKGYIVSHLPIHPSELQYSWRGNIHGHTHGNCINDPRYYNVSCEMINYTPKLFTEIDEEIQTAKMTSYE